MGLEPRPGLVLVAAAALLVPGLGATGPAAAEPKAHEGLDVSYFSFFEGWARGDYPLDSVPRFVEDGERWRCSREDIVRYRSDELRYVVHVHSAFTERLERFDELVVKLAKEHYGRAPRRLRHRGAFACRNARSRRGRISEHAFGNAIDVRGLDFWRLRDGEPPAGMPRHMRRGFRLRVGKHWSPRWKRYRYHAAFLHELAEKLRDRPDIFRGIVGPPRPRHDDHLHLDAAPWRYAMFGYDRVR